MQTTLEIFLPKIRKLESMITDSIEFKNKLVKLSIKKSKIETAKNNPNDIENKVIVSIILETEIIMKFKA